MAKIKIGGWADPTTSSTPHNSLVFLKQKMHHHSTQHEADGEAGGEEEDMKRISITFLVEGMQISQFKRSSASNEINNVSCLCSTNVMPALIVEAILGRS